MLNAMKTTLSRDLSVLTQRRLFWWALALWSLICSIVFFAYIDDFLAIQPTLRAKNSQYGVTDIVIIPYIKTLSLLGMLVVIALCSRLFYNEHFSAFSRLYRTTSVNPRILVVAKMAYVVTITFSIILLLAIPPLVSAFFFDYHFSRVIITLLAQCVLLFSVGLLAMVFSQVFQHSILVMLVSGIILLTTELAARLLVEPTWLAPIVAFFSPLAHINRISVGVVTLSDVVFFILLWSILIWLSLRQFNNTYLTSS